MNKKYKILLDGELLGTTLLEKADSSMGVVFGVITFANENIGYEFIRDFCKSKGVDLAYDFPDAKNIATRTIKNLKVFNDLGEEIIGEGNQIYGMDGEEFEISIEGIPYTFYQKEFPHHT